MGCWSAAGPSEVYLGAVACRVANSHHGEGNVSLLLAWMAEKPILSHAAAPESAHLIHNLVRILGHEDVVDLSGGRHAHPGCACRLRQPVQ